MMTTGGNGVATATVGMMTRKKSFSFAFCILSLLIHFTDVASQGTGTGVEVRPEMDFCTGATGPRPITGQPSPGTTREATIDDVNGGICGVEINTPGIWWWVNGTGEVIRASSCSPGTQIKVKLSVFTGNCTDLRCVTGGSRPDYECEEVTKGPDGEWGSISTAIDFPTRLGQHYYILVQQDSLGEPGSVWMSFRHPRLPQNDECINAVGPVPRDNTRILASTVDAAVSNIYEGYCDIETNLYPGVWFQVIGTGGDISVSACAENNVDGFLFSVYNGGFCDAKACVQGSYEVNIADEEKCSFGPGNVLHPLTRYTFRSRDRDRYFIYVRYAFTGVDRPTSDFRFYVDDGSGGKAGTSGAHEIVFVPQPTETDGDGNGNGNGNGDGSDGDKDKKRSSANTTFGKTTMFLLVLSNLAVPVFMMMMMMSTIM